LAATDDRPADPEEFPAGMASAFVYEMTFSADFQSFEKITKELLDSEGAVLDTVKLDRVYTVSVKGNQKKPPKEDEGSGGDGSGGDGEERPPEPEEQNDNERDRDSTWVPTTDEHRMPRDTRGPVFNMGSLFFNSEL
jgi:hypothetical protein